MGNFSDTCVFSVVFPANIPYLHDFFNSFATQEDKDFEVLLINDGIDNINDYLNKYPNVRFEVFSYSDTPAKIREKGLGLLIEKGYSNIVFADSDDYFSSNRISHTKKLLGNYDLIACELVIVDSRGKVIINDYLSSRLGDSKEITKEFIVDKNIFGLSNSAVKGSMLRSISIPQEMMAVDWFIFSKLMVENTKAIFSSTAKCYYRQHHTNAIGFAEITPERLKKSIRNKLLHYKAMSDELPEYLGYYKLVEEVEIYIRDNFDTYYNKINKLNLDHPLWWEEAKTLKDLNL